jgi:hypothetical protein
MASETPKFYRLRWILKSQTHQTGDGVCNRCLSDIEFVHFNMPLLENNHHNAFGKFHWYTGFTYFATYSTKILQIKQLYTNQ